MSNRNLVDYFSPTNVNKRVAAAVPDQEPAVSSVPVENKAVNGGTKPRRSRKVRGTVCENETDDSDFVMEEPILPQQNGNAITKYFTPVDKAKAAVTGKKTASPCVLTVQAQVHGSPKKSGSQQPNDLKKPLKKKKKKKTGIPGSQADKIELVSSEPVLVWNEAIDFYIVSYIH